MRIKYVNIDHLPPGGRPCSRLISEESNVQCLHTLYTKQYYHLIILQVQNSYKRISSRHAIINL